MVYKKLFFSLTFLLSIFFISFISSHHHFINLIILKSFVLKFSLFAPILFIFLFAIATIFFVPAMPLSLAGGFLFDIYHGLIYNMVGSTLGASCAFLLARYYGQDWIRKKAGKRLQMVLNGVKKEGWRYVALLRLMPLTPFTLLNYIFGITSIRFTHFAVTSFLFSFPGCYAFAYIGHWGGHALSHHIMHVKETLLGLGLLATLLFIIQVVKNFHLGK